MNSTILLKSSKKFDNLAGHSTKEQQISVALFVFTRFASLRETKQSIGYAFSLDRFVVPPPNDAKQRQKKDTLADVLFHCH